MDSEPIWQKEIISTKKYKAFVHEGIDQPGPWENLKARCFLGSEKFIEKMQKLSLDNKKSSEIPKQQCIFGRPSFNSLFKSKDQLSKTNRNKMIKEAFLTYSYTQSEISKYLGLYYSTINRLINTESSLKS